MNLMKQLKNGRSGYIILYKLGVGCLHVVAPLILREDAIDFYILTIEVSNHKGALDDEGNPLLAHRLQRIDLVLRQQLELLVHQVVDFLGEVIDIVEVHVLPALLDYVVVEVTQGFFDGIVLGHQFFLHPEALKGVPELFQVLIGN
jgi:hypothetical protein